MAYADLIAAKLMNFLIADTFTDSLARLTGEEQKAVKTTTFDHQPLATSLPLPP
jgi:hypothetical protein